MNGNSARGQTFCKPLKIITGAGMVQILSWLWPLWIADAKASDAVLAVDSNITLTQPNGLEQNLIAGDITTLEVDAFQLTCITSWQKAQTIAISEEEGLSYTFEIPNGQTIYVNFTEQNVTFFPGTDRQITVGERQFLAANANNLDIGVTVVTGQTTGDDETEQVLAGGAVFPLDLSSTPASASPTAQSAGWSFTLASWNLLNLSDNKVGLTGNPADLKTDLLDNYAQILGQFDVTFIQEILSLDAFGQVCGTLQETKSQYQCLTVPGIGASGLGRPLNNRREYYGLVYNSAVFSTTPRVRGTADDQDAWERPPMRTKLRFPLPAGGDYVLTVVNIHTKPAYAAKDKHTDHQTRNASVANELAAVQDLVQNRPSPGNIVVTGDLNADCGAYPTFLRTQFPSPWVWYINSGQKTNTALKSSCAYDRFIFNGDAQWEYLAHGIYTGNAAPDRPFINGRLNGKRVSDHYLIWTKIGGGGVRTDQSEYDLNDAVTGEGDGFQPNRSDIELFVVLGKPDKGQLLIDVSGGTETVSTDSQGAFQATVVWAEANPIGGYSLVADTNNDQKYDPDTDALAPFRVTDKKRSRTVMVSVNGIDLQESIPTKKPRTEESNSLFGQARGLGESVNVSVWVTSLKQMDVQYNIHSWSAMNGKDLAPMAPPGFPLNIQTNEDGSLFTLLWPDLAASFTPELRREYGTLFNFVVDVNQNGIFDAGTDLVDTTDITTIQQWFADKHTSLGPNNGNGTPAVGQYKAFLEAKLPPEVVVTLGLDPSSDQYDEATLQASQIYLCSPILTDANLLLLQQGSQIGFRLVTPEQEVQNRIISTGGLHLDRGRMTGLQVVDSAVTCFTGSDLEIDGILFEPNVYAVLQATKSMAFENDVQSRNQALTTAIAPKMTIGPGFSHTLAVPAKPAAATGPVFSWKTWRREEL